MYLESRREVRRKQKYRVKKSPYMQIRVKPFVLNENPHLHLDPCRKITLSKNKPSKCQRDISNFIPPELAFERA